MHGKEYLPHGIDVAYSTVETAALREKLATAPYPEKGFAPVREEYIAKMQEIYGEVGAGCVALQDRIGRYGIDRAPAYRAHEDEIRALFAATPTAKEIEEMLRVVGLDIDEFYALYGEEKIKTALSYAKDLKDRYSVLWMYYDLFGEVQ